MLALLDGRNHFADIFAILCDGVADLEVPQGNLVSEGYFLECREFDYGPAVKGHASSGLRGMQIGDGHTHRITVIMHKEISHSHSSLSIQKVNRRPN
jgi:hypothetical protein